MDEFETAAGRYRSEIRERATCLMTALLAPLTYEDRIELRVEWELLAGALDDSPSLRERVEPDLQAAWRSVRRSNATLPAACPWPTLAALRQALDAALAAGGHATTTERVDFCHAPAILGPPIKLKFQLLISLHRGRPAYQFLRNCLHGQIRAPHIKCMRNGSPYSRDGSA